MAVSLLENGEAHKAYDLFMKSASGVLTEPFLEKIILQPSPGMIEELINFTFKLSKIRQSVSKVSCMKMNPTVALGICCATTFRVLNFELGCSKL